MKRRLPLLVLVTASCTFGALGPLATPASAQIFDKLGKAAVQAKAAHDDLTFTDEEEQDLGKQVSAKIRERFGVVQDPAIHRYVTLVGLALASESKRPNLPWTFIVLDTDAVNAFAAPGGYVHITRGALAMMSNEAELAGVLGHELTHVTEKHTIAALKKAKGVDLAMKASGKGDSKITAGLVDKMKDAVIQGYGQKEELESDAKGLALANSVGYAPTGLPGFLQKLADRNKGNNEKRGLFASHPAMQERLDKMNAQIKRDKLNASATLEARLKKYVTYKPVPQSGIATVQAGSAGLAGGSDSGNSKNANAKASDKDNKSADNKTAKKDDSGDDSKKKGGGFGLSKLGSSFGGGEKKEAQVVGSGAGRGLGDPEVDAKGGGNPALVAVKVTPADVETFKKEGKLS